MRNRPQPFSSERRRQLRMQKFVEQHGLCFYCKVEMHIMLEDSRPVPSDAATIEHKIPQWQRPDLRKDPANIVLACNACNSKKGKERAPRMPSRKRA